MNSTTTSYLYTFAPLILIFVALWFFMIRPQKKRDNETKRMRNNLQEGDQVVTIGGIVGQVLTVKEDSIVIYVGSDKTKMEFKKWAIGEVTLKSDKPVKTEAVSEPAEAEDADASKKKIRKLTRKDESDENPLE